ncbi:enoyl-CoA hydratase/isomerase family protein [Blastococcus mobilis]|uniref:Enoyl-CoA hydratase n=1 Tax=Blastococcus mobilis TaxID=1938746 RepID=A0A239AKC1_9ACTN|nr:enoyl-CoA hydratase/isomerase family protein [Blastococcus mobilis]SNR95970.1 enoyl-CoA hydratase [Blastococcus mobilis]
MTGTTLRITEDDGVATVVLDRPQRLNALTEEMFEELPRALQELDADPSVRVILLTGAGRGFCAGMDLADASSLPERVTAELVRAQDRWGQATLALREISVPVIAAVNGPAAGAGLSLALAADIRVASTAARFNAAFIKIGLTGGDVGSSWLLPRIVGLGHAYELLLTGRLIDATEALRIGLVNRVVEPDELLPTAGALAREIAANSPTGVRLTKQVVQTNVDAPSLRGHGAGKPQPSAHHAHRGHGRGRLSVPGQAAGTVPRAMTSTHGSSGRAGLTDEQGWASDGSSLRSFRQALPNA